MGTLLGNPLVMLATSFALATANFLLVEQPFRKTNISAPRILCIAAIAIIATIALSEHGATNFHT